MIKHNLGLKIIKCYDACLNIQLKKNLFAYFYCRIRPNRFNFDENVTNMISEDVIYQIKPKLQCPGLHRHRNVDKMHYINFSFLLIIAPLY